ncbi:MAG: L,D-transpeptidase family protein, partial [Fimbriimonadaceae bacterium]|nr:L,D-transpeptidase family protein [Alphaproteobacteria bacterium]
YNKHNFPFTLRQAPGPQNALGRVKFMFPNEHSVYLHDTPSRNLFERTARAFSSGCIRLHRPLDLAEQILQTQGVAGWTRARINQTIETRQRTIVNLAEPLNVHLTYSTAWVGEGGTLNFRPDIYGRDKKLYRALFALPTSS